MTFNVRQIFGEKPTENVITFKHKSLKKLFNKVTFVFNVIRPPLTIRYPIIIKLDPRPLL